MYIARKFVESVRFFLYLTIVINEERQKINLYSETVSSAD